MNSFLVKTMVFNVTIFAPGITYWPEILSVFNLKGTSIVLQYVLLYKYGLFFDR